MLKKLRQKLKRKKKVKKYKGKVPFSTGKIFEKPKTS